MAGFYDRMQGVADNLLTRFNQGTIELVKLAPGAGPASNPGPSVRTVVPLKGTAQAVKGNVLLEPNSLVKVGDLKVSAKVVDGVAPTVTDKIIIDGKEYKIIRFDAIPPAGVTVAWAFYIRR